MSCNARNDLVEKGTRPPFADQKVVSQNIFTLASSLEIHGLAARYADLSASDGIAQRNKHDWL
jgi:hypothetical protein